MIDGEDSEKDYTEEDDEDITPDIEESKKGKVKMSKGKGKGSNLMMFQFTLPLNDGACDL